ncbi:MAG: OmpA family protein [Alphaproteobacteria bacterium]|nr:OmpA family protein [Alphaproteobacteria bacterium]
MSAMLLLLPAALTLPAHANSTHVTSVDNGIVLRPDTYLVDTRNSAPPVENFTDVYVDPMTLAERLKPAAPPAAPTPPAGQPASAPSFPPKGVLPIINKRLGEATITVNDIEIGQVHSLTEAALHDVKWGCYDVQFAYEDDSVHKEQLCTTSTWRTPFPGGPDAAKYLEDGRPARSEAAWMWGPPDRDHDGIADQDDECPAEAGPESAFGCPDGDEDRVPDYRDACPMQKANARADAKKSDGCPSRVFISQKAIVITDKIFFKTGKATIKPESHALLDEIAGVLAKHEEIKKVEVAGHTDDQGKDDANLKLSQGRSEAVMAYLVGQGIAADRLVAKGYGETEPIGDNTTDEGRAQNRRVEFRILEQAKAQPLRRQAPRMGDGDEGSGPVELTAPEGEDESGVEETEATPTEGGPAPLPKPAAD